jgi:hypothetical protein
MNRLICEKITNETSWEKEVWMALKDVLNPETLRRYKKEVVKEERRRRDRLEKNLKKDQDLACIT